MTSLAIILSCLSTPSILFVGNSYTMGNGGLWTHVKQVYESVETDTLQVDVFSAGGASYESHWGNQLLRDEIESGAWDTVIFQEQSCMPVVDPSNTYLFGDSLAWLTAAAGGVPAFFMTWARKNDPLMLEGLELGYSRMGAVHNSIVTPCGIAFDVVRRFHPEIDPYDGDGAHPSLHGTYLAACVITISLYDSDISSDSVWQPAEISLQDGEVLRSMAVLACSIYLQP